MKQSDHRPVARPRRRRHLRAHRARAGRRRVRRPPPSPPRQHQPGTPQRSKMKTCNADAKTKDLHGADRRAFMKQCLSGKAKPAAAS